MNATIEMNNAPKLKGISAKVCLTVSKLFLSNGPLKQFGFRKSEITRFDTMENYVADRVEQIGEYRELFSPFVSFAGKTVLELGCNKGYIINSFLQHEDFRAIGAEIDADALKIAREIGNKNSEIMILSNMGGALIVSGDCEKAETHLNKTMQLIGDSEHFILMETFQFLAEALHGQNKNADALRAAKRSLELSQKAENKGVIANVWRVLGLIAANLGEDLTINNELFNASQCFDKALQIFTETKMEAETARTLRDLARYENKRGNSGKARKMLDEARENFTRLEMPLEIERCSV